MWKIYFERFKKNKPALAGLSIILLLVIIAILAPFISPYNPIEQILSERLQPPSRLHPLGTDDLGRDVLSRVIYGSRISLSVGVIAVGISITIGVLLGLVSGYFGGIIDSVLMRVVDIVLCFPTFFLILMVISFIEPSIYNIMVVIGLTGWPSVTRLVRSECLSLREREFILAAKGLKLKTSRILFTHLLPNVIAPIVVTATLSIGSAILIESGLSFLGLGVQPPTPSWGNILTSGKDYIHIAWWLSVFPGLAILIVVLAFNLLGEGLRDILDPRALE